MRHRQPQCRRGTDQTRGPSVRRGSIRLSRHVKNEMSNEIGSSEGLVVVTQGFWSTLRESRHRPPSSEKGGQRKTEECIFEVRQTSTRRSWRLNVCEVSYRVSYEGKAIPCVVYADGGARDPSVLNCNKSSHIEARGGSRQRGLGTLWLVMALICANALA